MCCEASTRLSSVRTLGTCAALHVAHPASGLAMIQELLCVMLTWSRQHDQQHDHHVCAMPVKCHSANRPKLLLLCFLLQTLLGTCLIMSYYLVYYISIIVSRPVHATIGSLMGQMMCHCLDVGLYIMRRGLCGALCRQTRRASSQTQLASLCVVALAKSGSKERRRLWNTPKQQDMRTFQSIIDASMLC